jgi:hypothetical protein
MGTDETWTDEYKDTLHVVLQSLNQGFVVALGFFPVKGPEGVGTAVKIAYHARFSTRIIGDRATFVGVFNQQLLPLWWPWGTTYPDYGLQRVVLEYPRQTDPRRVLLVLAFV